MKLKTMSFTSYLLVIIFIINGLLSAITMNAAKNTLFTREDLESTIQAYQTSDMRYKNSNQFDLDIWENYGLLVKKGSNQNIKEGDHYYIKAKDPRDLSREVKKFENKKVNNQWKYLGTNIEGYLVANPDYPHEPKTKFSQFKWEINSNDKTSLWKKLKEIEDTIERKKLYDYYLNMIKDSFRLQYNDLFDEENFTPEIEEAMMRAAITVYPITAIKEKRVMISFRNSELIKLRKNKPKNRKNKPKNKSKSQSKNNSNVGRGGHSYNTTDNGEEEIIYELTASNINLSKKKPTPIHESKPLIPTAGDIPKGDLWILSEYPGQEKFDTRKGIPTGEKVYVTAQFGEYIAYAVPATNTYSHPEVSQEKNPKTGKMEEVITMVDYTYMTFEQAYVYKIKKVDVYNHSLPEGKVELIPRNYEVTASVEQGGYKVENGSVTTWDAKLTINGVTITAGEAIPDPKLTAPGVLYAQDIVIPVATTNAKDTESMAQAEYVKILELTDGASNIGTKSDSIQKSVYGNLVTVHTPVVAYPKVSMRPLKANEKYEVTKNQPIALKEETIKVEYPISGQHLDIPNYGNRDYSEYTAKRQVRFSFDVYLGKGYDGIYLKAGQWHDFPVALSSDEREAAEKQQAKDIEAGKIQLIENPEDKNHPLLQKTPEFLAELAKKNKEKWANLNAKQKKQEEEAEYFIPSWVKESENHVISFRSIPINLAVETSQAYERNANKDVNNYKAVDTIDLSVFGKFKQIEIVEVRDGRKRDSLALPVYPQADLLKKRQDGAFLGMPVDFRLRTTHDLFYGSDYIKVTPKYTFVDKQGNKTEVDIYFHGNMKLRKISTANTEIKQKSRLKDFSKWYEPLWVEDTAMILDSQKRNHDVRYKEYYGMLNSNRYTKLGDNSEITIGERLKLYSGRSLTKSVNIPEELNKKKVYQSIQDWHFRFFLPNESYFVPKGTDFTGKSGISIHKEPFLHQGYVMVQLKFEVFKKDKLFMTYYTEPVSTPTIPYQAEYGDAFFYDTERRASQRLN